MIRKTNQPAGRESRAKLCGARTAPRACASNFSAAETLGRAHRCAARRPCAAACPRNRRDRSKCAWRRFPETASPRFRPARRDNSALPKSWDRGEAFALGRTSTDAPAIDAHIVQGRAEIGAGQRQDRPLRKNECSAEQHHLQSRGALPCYQPIGCRDAAKLDRQLQTGETPMGPKPGRPRSCTVVSSPGACT